MACHRLSGATNNRGWAAPPRIEIEPVSSVVGLTRWTPDDDAVVIDAASYDFISRDPSGTIIEPVSGWPEPERKLGSFALTYMAGLGSLRYLEQRPRVRSTPG